MYNGIGLSTVRGSSTSGHVQKNHSYVRPEFFRNKLDKNTGRQQNQSYANNGGFKVNKEVIDHNRKFALEAEVFELQETLADAGESQENIDKQVTALRAKQQQTLVSVSGTSASNSRKLSSTDTHAAAAAKERENVRVRGAFGLGENFAPGAAFDKEAQEQRRQQREEDRVREREQREIDYQKRVQARAERAEKDRQREEEYRKGREERVAAAAAPLGTRGEKRHAGQYQDSRDRNIRRSQDRRDGGGNRRSGKPRYVPVDREYQEQGRDRDRSRSRSRDREHRHRGSGSGSSSSDEDGEVEQQMADSSVSVGQQQQQQHNDDGAERGDSAVMDRPKRRSRFSAVVAPSDLTSADCTAVTAVAVDTRAQARQEELQRVGIDGNRESSQSPSPPRGDKKKEAAAKKRRSRSRSPSYSSSDSSRSSRSSSSSSSSPSSRSRSRSRSSQSSSRLSSEGSRSSSDSDSDSSSASYAASSPPRKARKSRKNHSGSVKR